MENSKSNFPYRKLWYDIYLSLEVMMNVEHLQVLQFMFEVNKATRSYLQKNIITIQNGFINAGLITYQLKSDFYHYQQLENIYFDALKRNKENRLITFQIDI